MAFSGDPFQILGLPPGASDAEIKRAYRALAKRYHPDSAGERALPRFLAIQAAYDMLTTPGRPPVTGAKPSPPSPPRDRTSTADADRARATREAFRARRTRPAPPGGSRPTSGPAWWAAGRAGAPKPGSGAPGTAAGAAGPHRAGGAAGTAGPEGAGGADGTGSRGADGVPGAGGVAGGPAGPAGPTDRRRRRPPRVATLGSTSYDDAPHEPEPSWAGATWYGDSSGTYWTVNPKEYADPRKHGPEYLARARRAAGAADPEPGGWPGTGDAGPTATPDPTTAAGPTSAGDPATSERARPQTGSGARTAPGGGSTTGTGPRTPGAGPARSTGATASARPESTRASNAGGPTAGGTSTSSAGPAGRTSTSTSTGSASTSAGQGFGAAPASAPRRPPATSPGRAFASSTASAGSGSSAGSATWAAPGDRVPPSSPFRPPPPPPQAAGQAAAFSDEADELPLSRALPQRLLVALLAWPPLGFAAGFMIGELTGCDRAAVTCGGAESLAPWVVQPAIVVLLLLLPRLARAAAVGSIAVGVAALLAVIVLSEFGGRGGPTDAARSLLLAILVMAWTVGLVGELSGRIPLPAAFRATD